VYERLRLRVASGATAGTNIPLSLPLPLPLRLLVQYWDWNWREKVPLTSFHVLSQHMAHEAMTVSPRGTSPWGRRLEPSHRYSWYSWNPTLSVQLAQPGPMPFAQLV
jgi:hypothetical protein